MAHNRQDGLRSTKTNFERSSSGTNSSSDGVDNDLNLHFIDNSANDKEKSNYVDIDDHGSSSIPKEWCWSRRFDETQVTNPDNNKPRKFRPSRPPLKESLPMIPMVMRLGRYLMQERREQREPMFQMFGLDFHPPSNWGPNQGVPLGGIGGGCIGRGFRGDFRRWSLHPGAILHHDHPTYNQFSLRVQRPNNSNQQPQKQACVLTSCSQNNDKDKKNDNVWNKMKASCGTCYALFPRAWYEYKNPLPGITIVSKQISPVIPHNYQQSSFPCAVFVFDVKNSDMTQDANVSIMFTFQNGQIDINRSDGGHCNRTFTVNNNDNKTVTGVEMKHRYELPILTARSPTLDSKFDHSTLTILAITLIVAILAATIVSLLFNSMQIILSWSIVGVVLLLLVLSTMRSFHLPPFFAQTPSLPTGSMTLPLSFAIAIPTSQSNTTNNDNDESSPITSTTPLFETSCKKTTDKLWNQWVSTGFLERKTANTSNGNFNDDEFSIPCAKGVSIGSAIAQTFQLKPGETKRVIFSLSWDMPKVTFAEQNTYYRRYTDFFGRNGTAAPALATYALNHCHEWEESIENWQKPVLTNPTLPLWYKQQLFNELYYIVDGGTLWTSSSPLESEQDNENSQTDDMEANLQSRHNRIHSTKSAMLDPRKRIGRFLYLEGHEYLMYNTYDVHFYASFALAMLWPELELSLQRDIIDVVASENKQKRYLIGHNDLSNRKVKGAVPHDVGSPSGIPWTIVNDYVFQDVSRWKDLDSKLVLQLYRDFIATGDVDFLKAAWPAIQSALDHLGSFDTDGDGIPENEGFPDQTFDIWIVKGPSAYTGGLWLAALSAACAVVDTLSKEIIRKQQNTTNDMISNELNDSMSDSTNSLALNKNQECKDDDPISLKKLQDCKETYQRLLEKGRLSYTEKLWNGKYFNYDASDSPYHDTIMADQLAGQWYARACGLPPITKEHHIHKALSTVFENNVMGFQNGTMGAINGIRPLKNNHDKNAPPKVDKSCIQSQEVWTGVTYAVSAAMLQECMILSRSSAEKAAELREQAFLTSEGILKTGWNKFGYFFQTPEGWDIHGNYRSLAYMRPLSIWAMQWALEVVPHISAEGKSETKK